MELPLLLDKEAVSTLVFNNKRTDDLCQNLLADLHRAMVLGNLHKGKVEIVFRDNNLKLYKIRTTVWSLTQDYVGIKGGIFIPINSIEKVSF